MDLGSLELQIFVSLTVVLGGAFVALVCDYLKGNNEQLREHNIELRVRKEEQERRLLLDPAGFLGQWMPGQRQAAARTITAAEPSAVNRAVAPHEVMQSFADPEALAEADDRAAKLHARAGDEPFETADVPPMTQRRNGRNRGNRKSSRQVRKEPENYADWVRPEIIAKVARRAQATAAYSSDIREELESLPEESLPEPLNAPESWDIRHQLPANDRTKREQPKRSTPRADEVPAAAQVTTAAVAVMADPAAPQETVAAAAQVPQEAPLPEKLAPEEAVVLQKEIERVAQLERRPVTAAPGTILRPLTVPSLKLEDELQRVAEIAPVAAPAAFTWNSALLDEVIAASGTREAVAHTAAPLVAAPEPVVVAETVTAPVVIEETVAAVESQEEVELVEVPPVVAASEPESVPTASVVEELATVDVTLGHNEYWEPAAGSSGGGSDSATDQPDVSLPESPSVEFVVASLSADSDVAPELVEPFALLAEPVAIVASVDDEPASTGALPVEEPLVIATVEPESVLAAPVVEELVTVAIALDQIEYWEPAAVSTDQPEVVLPEAPAVERTVDVVSTQAETAAEQSDSVPELVPAFALLPEPVAAVASVDDELVSPVDLLVEEPVVIAALEPSSTPAEPVAEELVAVDPASDRHEYWEPAAVSIDQPKVSLPDTNVVELAVAAVSAQTETVDEQSDSIPEPVQALAVLPESAATVAGVDEEPVSPVDLLVEEPVVIAAVELSSNPAEPVSEELVAVDPALDQHEYWEPAAVSIDQPEVSLPEAPAVELAVASLSVQADTVAEQSESVPEPVQAFALLSEPAATTVSVDEEPVSTGDPLAIEPDLESIAIAEVTEPLAETNPLELTIETPLTPVEALPVPAETEEPDFVEAFLPAELPQSVPFEPIELEVSPELSPVFAEALTADTEVEPPPFVYLIDSVVEPVELQETEPQLPVVFEVAQDSESTETAAVEPPPFVFEFDSDSIPEPIAEPEPVVAEVTPVPAAEIIDCYSFWPRQSRLAGMGISPMVDYLQSIPGVETPSVRLPLVAEPALTFIEAESNLESFDDSSALPELLPAFADLNWEEPASSVPVEPEVLAAIVEPPPLWIPEPQADPEPIQSLVPAAPIDISALRQPEPELVAPAPPSIPDLLLPTGMHDISTWTRLLSLPNPMTGILIVISLQPSENRSTLPQPKGAAAPENNSPAIDKFMASFVREGDFGSHISENQWVFIYSNDVAGFNQRRVGMISEKLWDFQLRHLGLANVNFKWGAIDVQSEPLSAALDAARDRMNQTNRARKLPGADRVAPRRVVNG